MVLVVDVVVVDVVVAGAVVDVDVGCVAVVDVVLAGAVVDVVSGTTVVVDSSSSSTSVVVELFSTCVVVLGTVEVVMGVGPGSPGRPAQAVSPSSAREIPSPHEARTTKDDCIKYSAISRPCHSASAGYRGSH